MDEELADDLTEDMDFHFNKVKCRKIGQMLPKLMKMVERDTLDVRWKKDEGRMDNSCCYIVL